MPDEDEKHRMFRDLVDRILYGDGRASAEQRAAAFTSDLGPDAVPAEDLDEDVLFELTICAAVGRASRLYDAGLAALAEATREGGAGDAS